MDALSRANQSEQGTARNSLLLNHEKIEQFKETFLGVFSNKEKGSCFGQAHYKNQKR
jgi:hypothetical protein